MEKEAGPNRWGGSAVPRHPRCRHSGEAEMQNLPDRDMLDAGIMSRACIAMARCRRGFGSGCNKSDDASNNGSLLAPSEGQVRARGVAGEATLAAL
jgi:hypothetical protein